MDTRYGRVKWGKGNPRSRTKTWGDPVKWNKGAVGAAQRPRVFCASLADWLDEEVPIEWLADLLKLIHDTPHLDWLLLTKRPENFERRVGGFTDSYLALGAIGAFTPEGQGFADWLADWRRGTPPSNVWIGTSVEDQARADERIPSLLEIPARVRFLSCEPLLETVQLGAIKGTAATPGATPLHDGTMRDITFPEVPGVDWVICGGESGPGRRPFNADWARSLRDQCAMAGVPFFMKQMDKVTPIPSDLMIRQFPNV